MEIKRDKYLNDLIVRKNNGFIKVITGIRRCGKSYLMNTIFYSHLLQSGIKPNQIIKFSFDNDEDIDKLDYYLPNEPTKIYERGKKTFKVDSKKFRMFIKDATNDHEQFFLLLDEIQILDNFVGTLNGFLTHNNFDVYVTGSNSRMLSSEIITEFRGRGDRINMYPLSFKEFYQAFPGNFNEVYKTYSYYGGMPPLTQMQTEQQKSNYLKDLFQEVYLKDILDRNQINNVPNFEKLIDLLASNVGSYTNSKKLERAFKSELNETYSDDTIATHLSYLIDCFLISRAKPYDVKGKKYINSNSKFYFTDIGLRNARLNFRQQEPTHIMENIIFNELLYQGFNVDVGVIEVIEKNKSNNSVRKQLEVDFIVQSEDDKYYIQSVYSIPDSLKLEQEERPLTKIKDSFQKIIIVADDIKSWRTENGTKIISLKDFLLSDNPLK